MESKNHSPITSELAFGQAVITTQVLAHIVVHLGLRDNVKRFLIRSDAFPEIESAELKSELKAGRQFLRDAIDSIA